MKRIFIVVFFLLFIASFTMIPEETKMNKKENICLYTGPGGELAGNVAYGLEKAGFAYRKLKETGIKKGKLQNCTVLIIPGGYTKKAVASLQDEFERIREFVANGGCYIGICAGAYLASDTVKEEGKPSGLGIADIENTRKDGTGIKEIYLKDHPITKGLEGKLGIYYQNGPEIEIEGNMEKVAAYQNGTGAVVAGSYGKGKVVIFSPHPEGMKSRGIQPSQESLKLLKNSIRFCGVKENEN